MDDELNILPISSLINNITPVSIEASKTNLMIKDLGGTYNLKSPVEYI